MSDRIRTVERTPSHDHFEDGRLGEVSDPLDGPAVAHIGWTEPVPLSLCGAPILSVPPAKGWAYLHKCPECLRLLALRRARVEGAS